MLSVLFRLMLVYDSTVADNYRAITISPCISKAFESCFISIFSPWLESDILQFGFKKGMGCRDAIYTVKGVVNHINSNGSTAVLCALDLTKAFDKMNHYSLYIKLMDRNIPKCFLDVLLRWYSKCFAYVRWGTTISKNIPVTMWREARWCALALSICIIH